MSVKLLQKIKKYRSGHNQRSPSDTQIKKVLRLLNIGFKQHASLEKIITNGLAYILIY